MMIKKISKGLLRKNGWTVQRLTSYGLMYRSIDNLDSKLDSSWSSDKSNAVVFRSMGGASKEIIRLQLSGIYGLYDVYISKKHSALHISILRFFNKWYNRLFVMEWYPTCEIEQEDIDDYNHELEYGDVPLVCGECTADDGEVICDIYTDTYGVYEGERGIMAYLRWGRL